VKTDTVHIACIGPLSSYRGLSSTSQLHWGDAVK